MWYVYLKQEWTEWNQVSTDQMEVMTKKNSRLDKPVRMLATFYQGSFFKHYLIQANSTNPMMVILAPNSVCFLSCALHFVLKGNPISINGTHIVNPNMASKLNPHKNKIELENSELL